MQKESLESFNAFTQLATGIAKRTSDYALSAMNDWFAAGSSNLKELSNAKKMEDVVEANTKIASEASNKLVKCSQDTLKLIQENSADFSKFMETFGRNASAINPLNPAKYTTSTGSGQKV